MKVFLHVSKMDIPTTSFLCMHRRIKSLVFFFCKYVHIRGVLLLECDNLESSKAKKSDEMRRSSLMENWCSGFLEIVKCFSTGHLLANKIIGVTLYMLYIYGFSGCSKILIRKKKYNYWKK